MMGGWGWLDSHVIVVAGGWIPVEAGWMLACVLVLSVFAGWIATNDAFALVPLFDAN